MERSHPCSKLSVPEPSSVLKYLVPEPSFIPEFSISCSDSAYQALMGLFTRIMDDMPHFKPISVVKLSEFVFNKLFDGVNLPYAVIEYLHLALFGVFPSSRNVSDEISIFFPYSISAIISGYTVCSHTPILKISYPTTSINPEFDHLAHQLYEIQQHPDITFVTMENYGCLKQIPLLKSCIETEKQLPNIEKMYGMCKNIINITPILEILKQIFPEMTKCLYKLLHSDVVDKHKKCEIVTDCISYLDPASVLTEHHDPNIQRLREFYLFARFSFTEICVFINMIYKQLAHNVEPCDVLSNITHILG